MNNEQQKKAYTAPAFEVVELPNQADLLICSKNADGLCELGLADSTKEFFA
jgi:hypothetical protein